MPKARWRARLSACTGEAPEGYVYRCRRIGRALRLTGSPSGGVWDSMETAPPLHVGPAQAHNGRITTWRAGHNEGALYFGFICHEPHMDRVRADTRDPTALGPDDQVHVVVRPSQFEETRIFLINARGAREYNGARAMNDVDPRGGEERLARLASPPNYRWTAEAAHGADYWSLTIRIPFSALGLSRGHRRPLRFSISRAADLLGKPENQSLMPPPDDPGQEQLGWLVFAEE